MAVSIFRVCLEIYYGALLGFGKLLSTYYILHIRAGIGNFGVTKADDFRSPLRAGRCIIFLNTSTDDISHTRI